MANENQGQGFDDSGRSINVGLIVGLLGVVAFLLFIFQNTEDTDVEWLMFDVSMPKYLLLLITSGITLAVSVIGVWVVGRRRR
ncbi:MAG: hypothetical protein RIE08_07855 [Acidimicrobiales bacterium]